jgi:hypothetical protein
VVGPELLNTEASAKAAEDLGAEARLTPMKRCRGLQGLIGPGLPDHAAVELLVR